jgi:hypothetical protein
VPLAPFRTLPSELTKRILAALADFVHRLDKDSLAHTPWVPRPSESGQEVARYPNGQVKFRGAYLDGEMHGAWEFFRTDGSRMRTGAFDRGRQIGVWLTYDGAGRLVKETRFG